MLMTADLADALKSQIYRCWIPPVGAPNADDLIVDFDLQLNPDGTVAPATADSGSYGAGCRQSLYPRRGRGGQPRDLSMRSPTGCRAERYDQWHEINPLRFRSAPDDGTIGGCHVGAMLMTSDIRWRPA